MPEMNELMPLNAVKIDDKTYSIEDNGVRCLLFIGTERALIVDSGFGNAKGFRALIESLTDKPLTLVVTHGDPDHTGNIAEFDSIYMHPAEIAHFHREVKSDIQIVPVWEGDIFDIGGRCLEVVLIPGHTTGSIALLDRENRIIVTGDSISAGPVFMFGEGREIQAYMASMEKLIRMKNTFDSIFPAHGPLPLTTGQIDKSLVAAKKLLANELSPEEPPFPLPAKMYMHDGAGFYY